MAAVFGGVRGSKRKENGGVRQSSWWLKPMDNKGAMASRAQRKRKLKMKRCAKVVAGRLSDEERKKEAAREFGKKERKRVVVFDPDCSKGGDGLVYTKVLPRDIPTIDLQYVTSTDKFCLHEVAYYLKFSVNTEKRL
ncbi:hypothetical protein Droror1_Dr00026871 [Drosera rotundifolia]